MARAAYHACRTFVSESIYITFISHFYRFYEWNTEILYMGLMCSGELKGPYIQEVMFPRLVELVNVEEQVQLIECELVQSAGARI